MAANQRGCGVVGSTKIKSISGFPRKLREAAASQNAANLLLDDTGADAEVVPLLVKTHKQRIRRRENQTRWIEEARTLKKAGDNLNYQLKDWMSRFKNDLKVDEQRRAPAWGAGAPGSACEQSTVFEEGITANQEAMESARLMLQDMVACKKICLDREEGIWGEGQNSAVARALCHARKELSEHATVLRMELKQAQDELEVARKQVAEFVREAQQEQFPDVTQLVDSWPHISASEHDINLSIIRANCVERLRRAFEQQQISSQECRNFNLEFGETGSWDETDHTVFLNSKLRSRSRQSWLQRVVDQLPNRDKSEILAHEQWYRKSQAIQSKRQQATRGLEKAILEVKAWSYAEVLEARKRADEAVEAEAELKAQEDRRLAIHSKLEALRLAAQNQTKAAESLAAKEALEVEEKKRLEARRIKERADHNRQLIAQYCKRLEQAKWEAAQGAQIAAEKEDRERRARLLRNRPRVEYREQLIMERQKRAEEQRRRDEETELQRLEILEAIAASVPYRDAIENAKSDLLQSTVAARAHAEQFCAVDKDARGQQPLLGFDNAKLFKDLRFRLGIALHEAGLSTSKAAHNAVMARAGKEKAPF